MKHLRILALALASALAMAGASPALANGDTLTMTSPTYDTTGQKFGTAALSGGYGLSASSAGVTSASSVTIEAWIKPSSITRVGVIAEASTNIYIAVNASGDAEFSSGGASATVSSTVIGSGWHDLAMSCGATCYGLVDGAVVATFTPGTNTLYPQTAVNAYSTTPGVHYTSSNLDFNGQGEIDEVAFYNFQKYTAAYTPASSPLVGNESNLVALYHLDSSGADCSGGACIPATNYTLSEAAPSGAVGSPVTITATLNGQAGTNGDTITLSDNGGGGSFGGTIAVASGGISGTTTYTPASANAKTITSTDSAGYAASPSGGLTYTAVVPVAPSSAAFHFSPGDGWSCLGSRACPAGDAAYPQSWHQGAYFTVKWIAASSGATASLLLPSNTNAEQMSCFLNNVLKDNLAATGSISFMPTPGVLNTLQCWLRSPGAGLNSWGQGSGMGSTIQVQGLLLDAGSTAYTGTAWPTSWAKLVGDSITWGANTDGNNNNNFLHGHAFALCQYFLAQNIDCDVSAMAGDGWMFYGSINTTTRDVPGYYYTSGGAYQAAYSRWNLVDAGISELDAIGHHSAYGATGTEPLAIIYDLITNEVAHDGAAAGSTGNPGPATISPSNAQASVQQALVADHAAAPRAKQIVIEPFPVISGTAGSASASYLTALLNGVTASGVSLTLINIGSALAAEIYSVQCSTYAVGCFATDQYHPNVQGHGLVAAPLAAGIQSALNPNTTPTFRQMYH